MFGIAVPMALALSVMIASEDWPRSSAGREHAAVSTIAKASSGIEWWWVVRGRPGRSSGAFGPSIRAQSMIRLHLSITIVSARLRVKGRVGFVSCRDSR
ncbi:MAG: hypothetical protein ACRENI_14995 [Gemmatimonadaceae bacterium]